MGLSEVIIDSREGGATAGVTEGSRCAVASGEDAHDIIYVHSGSAPVC
jgi:hypothetical protein